MIIDTNATDGQSCEDTNINGWNDANVDLLSCTLLGLIAFCGINLISSMIIDGCIIKKPNRLNNKPQPQPIFTPRGSF